MVLMQQLIFAKRKKYNYKKEFISNIKLALTNLSRLENIEEYLIWRNKPEYNLMSLCFLCKGTTLILQRMIQEYKTDVTQFFSKDVVKVLCLKRDCEDLIKHKSQTCQRRIDQNEEERKSVISYLLLHLFVNIVFHINKMRKFCGLSQSKYESFLKDKHDLRIIEYDFNYFFPIFQKPKFGGSHRIDASEFMN